MMSIKYLARGWTLSAPYMLGTLSLFPSPEIWRKVSIGPAELGFTSGKSMMAIKVGCAINKKVNFKKNRLGCRMFSKKDWHSSR